MRYIYNNMIIINFGTTENMDKEIIPEVIYTLTINKNTINIQDYFIKHIPLLYSFVGFAIRLRTPPWIYKQIALE